MSPQELIVVSLRVSVLITVFGFGLQATRADILYLVQRPSLLARTLLAMLVIMPILAVVLVRGFALRPSVEIALVALAVSPIPPLLPGRGQRAGGHASYALGLMAIAGILAIFSVPATVQLLGRFFMRPFDMSSSAIARIVLMSIIVPLAAGMALRAILPTLASRFAKPVGRLAFVLLAISVLGLLYATLPSALSLIGDGTLIAMAAFILTGLAIGHWLGGPQDDHRVVLALSTATRHPAIALAIARANFPDEPHLVASIVLYALVNLLICIPYQVWRKRLERPAHGG